MGCALPSICAGHDISCPYEDTSRALIGLSAVAGIDVDVFDGEVAGPDAGGGAARAQIHTDRHVLREHLLVHIALVEGMFGSAPADSCASNGNIHAPGIEFHAGAAGGGEDASPVRVSTGEGCFHQRRIGDGFRDAAGVAFGSCAADFDFDGALRAFAILDDRERERFADAFERGRETLVASAG